MLQEATLESNVCHKNAVPCIPTRRGTRLNLYQFFFFWGGRTHLHEICKPMH
jgi:hypothetical protein